MDVVAGVFFLPHTDVLTRISAPVSCASRWTVGFHFRNADIQVMMCDIYSVAINRDLSRTYFLYKQLSYLDEHHIFYIVLAA